MGSLFWLVGLWIECGWLGNERTPTHVLPRLKHLISDTILTDADTPAIHITEYLILVFLTI